MHVISVSLENIIAGSVDFFFLLECIKSDKFIPVAPKGNLLVSDPPSGTRLMCSEITASFAHHTAATTILSATTTTVSTRPLIATISSSVTNNTFLPPPHHHPLLQLLQQPLTISHPTAITTATTTTHSAISPHRFYVPATRNNFANLGYRQVNFAYLSHLFQVFSVLENSKLLNQLMDIQGSVSRT